MSHEVRIMDFQRRSSRSFLDDAQIISLLDIYMYITTQSIVDYTSVGLNELQSTIHRVATYLGLFHDR